MYKKIAAVVVAAGLAMGLSACGEVSKNEPVVVVETQAVDVIEVPSVELEASPVEKAVVDTFRAAVPGDTTPDAEIISEAQAMAVELRSSLDSGLSGSDFLNVLMAEDSSQAVRNAALVQGAIALNPDLSSHPNY